MENNTAGLVIQLIIGLIALAGSGIGFFNMRANGRIKVQMAEIETRRIAEKGDIDNTANLINVIQSVVLGLKPSTDALTDASRTMENTSSVMATLVDITGEVLSKANATQAVLSTAIESMHGKSVERDQQMNDLPEKVRDEMSQELERIPKAVEEALTPKIETLKADIERLFQTMEKELSERIEAATDQIPSRTNELLRAELKALRQTIDTKFNDLVEAAKSVQIPDEDSEPKTDEPEPGEQPASADKEQI